MFDVLSLCFLKYNSKFISVWYKLIFLFDHTDSIPDKNLLWYFGELCIIVAFWLWSHCTGCLIMGHDSIGLLIYWFVAERPDTFLMKFQGMVYLSTIGYFSTVALPHVTSYHSAELLTGLFSTVAMHSSSVLYALLVSFWQPIDHQ